MLTVGSPAGNAHAAVIDNLSEAETDRVLSNTVDQNSHLMSDAWQGFVSIGTAFSAHDTVNHSQREYARGPVHTNSAEGYNDRVRRTISGVFHHISSQRVVATQAQCRTRKGHEAVRTLWSRIPPALQLMAVFRAAVGKQIRRTPEGSIHVKSAIAVFG